MIAIKQVIKKILMSVAYENKDYFESSELPPTDIHFFILDYFENGSSSLTICQFS